ncbi:MAG TPA: CPBP family intramembrane glutamic endopeptidase [Acidimicrobiales bacterium]|nr:CPBP family intramembrane glutamic endopeptidase [Acidimicrobiales bacterium]
MRLRVNKRIPLLIGGAPARPNSFGLGAAVIGLVTGWLIATAAVNLWPHARGTNAAPSLYAQDLLNLAGLWVGLLASVFIARRLSRQRPDEAVYGETLELGTYRLGTDRAHVGYLVQMRADYGIAIRPIDLLTGIVMGLFGQYLLTPLFELPLVPFIPDLFARLNDPANSLTHNITGSHFFILGLFVCLGSPIVEELYFRGLVLRALLGRFSNWRITRSPRLVAIALPVALDGVFFGVVHFEPLELLALSGFGVLLALLAWSSGRLGPGFIAHVTFNSATFIALARTH